MEFPYHTTACDRQRNLLRLLVLSHHQFCCSSFCSLVRPHDYVALRQTRPSLSLRQFYSLVIVFSRFLNPIVIHQVGSFQTHSWQVSEIASPSSGYDLQASSHNLFCNLCCSETTIHIDSIGTS